jgi:hypothetical protein
MISRLIWLALLAAVTFGCAGLRQFPERSVKYAEDLGTLDPDFAKLLDEVYSSATPESYRNKEIERRLRVTDIHFEKFSRRIGQESVGTNLAVNVVNVGSGVGGALVSGGTSQVLSGTSAFLTGSQQAFNKEALFDRTLPALLDQMVATRTAVKVRIFEGMGKSIEEYTLAKAMEDIEAYYRAGSIPGSVRATSEDATKKKEKAEDRLAKLRVSPYGGDWYSEALSKLLWPEGDRTKPPTKANVDWLRNWIDQQPELKELPIQKLLDSPDLASQRARALMALRKHLEGRQPRPN